MSHQHASIAKALLTETSNLFTSCLPHGRQELDLTGLKNTLEHAQLEFTDDEISCLLKKIDGDGDGLLSRTEYMKALGSPYLANRLSEAFTQADSNHDGFISGKEVHKALQLLGVYDISEMDAENLYERSSVKLKGGFDFYLFCKMTCPGILFMHRKKTPQIPADWDEVVRSIHYLAGALTIALVSFLPKPSPTVDTSKITTTPMPLVYQVDKPTGYRLIDTVALCFLLGWAFGFILSLRVRGKTYSRYYDCASLACAMMLLLILTYVLNAYLMIVLIVFAVLGGCGLYFTREN